MIPSSSSSTSDGHLVPGSTLSSVPAISHPESVTTELTKLLPSSYTRRTSTRYFKPPICLKDYLTKGSKSNFAYLYPIFDHVSYATLSPPYCVALTACSSVYEPTFFTQDFMDPKCIEAMKSEIIALEDNNTWTIVDLPLGKHLIGCKWVFKVKYLASGVVERYNARLVVKGFN